MQQEARQRIESACRAMRNAKRLFNVCPAIEAHVRTRARRPVHEIPFARRPQDPT